MEDILFLLELAALARDYDPPKYYYYLRRTKANCDVDLTMDMLLLREKYTRAVVLTGDGDFLPLFEYLRKNRKEVVIIAFARRTSRELRRFAGSRFIGLSNERYLLERK